MTDAQQRTVRSGAARRARTRMATLRSGRRAAALAVPVLAAVLGLGLTGCGGSSSSHTSSTATATAPAPPVVHATLSAPTHTPKVNAPWHYVVRVTAGTGQPVAAVVHLQALFQGVPVGQIGRHAVKNGVWSETIEWPPASVNQPLVFQVLATALGQTVTINYPLQVAPA